MTRLYAWIESEKGTEKTISANEAITVKVNYGSKTNSLKACYLIVTWKKGEQTPTVQLDIGEQTTTNPKAQYFKGTV